MSGTWRVGSTHRARVTGHYALDRFVQLSLQPSVLELVYMRAGDVNVGETLKGTITKLKENGLLVALSDKVTGFVGPCHYADIRLKHPERKFKQGATVKCRVLSVDSNRSRVCLTFKKSLLESTLPILTSPEDAKFGMVMPGVVQRVEERFVILEYYGGVRALVLLGELTDTQVSSTVGLFTGGQVVKSRITAVDRDAHKLTASIRQAAPSFQAPVDVSSIQVWSMVSGTLTAAHDENAILSLDEPEGAIVLIRRSNLANSRETTVPQLRALLDKGETVEDVTVISVNVDKAFVIVSAAKLKPKTKTKSVSSALRIDALTEGQVVSGRIGATMVNGIGVRLSKYVVGRLHLTNLSDDFTSPHAVPPVEGKILDVAIVRVDKHLKRVDVSLRKSRLEPEAGHQVVDCEVGGVEELKAGETVRGFVKSVMQHGVFVSLGRDVTARIQIKEQFDEYVKEWQSRFSPGQPISARVLSTNLNTSQVELTMRSVDGRVKSVVDFSLFIEIAGTKISGLCHKSEISDNKKANVSEALKSFREDDLVKVMILEVDIAKRKISFGIKLSYFVDEDAQMDGEEESESDGGEEDAVGGEELTESEEASEDGDSREDSEMDSGDEIADVSAFPFNFRCINLPPVGGSTRRTLADTKLAAPSNNAPALSLSSGFGWSVQSRDPEAPDASASNSGSGYEGSTSKPKKAKKKKDILQDLTADLHAKVPESMGDFERLVLGSPNSSFLWIQYMSFQLQLSEEKLNVWIALLNLENQFGTDDILEALFQDAARHNDSKTTHVRLAAILEESAGARSDGAVNDLKKDAKDAKDPKDSKTNGTNGAAPHDKNLDAEGSPEMDTDDLSVDEELLKLTAKSHRPTREYDGYERPYDKHQSRGPPREDYAREDYQEYQGPNAPGANGDPRYHHPGWYEGAYYDSDQYRDLH
ncbi:rRNA biogenesis protein rrp5 [Ceratobasidium sp. UAMH 11750]|nr:rRNA biogenesis protein rrp5 [Ceratobasidium sp. UAMH 11750]